MGIGASKGQGSEATYEKRDVETVSADKSIWPELAGAKLAESNGSGRKPHNKNNDLTRKKNSE